MISLYSQEVEEGEEEKKENAMVFSMFLANWEEQMRQMREAKTKEWEQKKKEFFGESNENEEDDEIEGMAS